MTTPSWPRPAILPPPDHRLVVVEASAGTGKTYFLEHRLVDLLLAGARLDQVLLVTFTDKATAELRGRIRDLVDRLARCTTIAESGTDAAPAWQLDEPTRARLREAITAFDHAPIFTIHGFCHRILIEDAFAARRLFDQTQVADEVAFDDAFFALLRGRFARDPEPRALLQAYLEAGHTVEQLRALLLRCARADATPRRRFDPAATLALAHRLRGALGDPAAFAATLTLKGHEKRWVPVWLEQLARLLARLTTATTAPSALALLDQASEPAGKLAPKLPPSPLADALAEVIDLMSIDEAIAGAFLPEVLARVGVDKAERGLFDYQDMLTLVADALRGPRGAELAARLRARLPWAMIDEFQDTDPLQWEIFRTVWLHPDAKGLTIVGDPKQAIYGFRGADVATYLAARDELLAGGAHRVILDVNRRATAALVEATNALLLGDGINTLLQGPITYDAPVRASGGVTCDDPRPPITLYRLDDATTLEPIRTTLGAAIADEIEALRRAAPSWHKGGLPRPFSLRDAMVLTRSNRESAELAAVLRGRGLPCTLLESDALFATREASELADVLAAVAAPRDRAARLRALRTRFFDVPWRELLTVVDAPDHHPLLSRLTEWSGLALRRAYEPLFRRLVEDSRLAERALVIGGGERVLTNTWHVLELLLETVARSRGDLHELVAELRRWMRDDTARNDERDVQRAETDGDAVRVLTIHKAKGLEAPYVFLYGLTGTPPPSPVRTIHDHHGRALLVGKQREPLEAQSKREQVEENQRLIYVALTRAQLRLYVPILNVKVIKPLAALHPLTPCLATVTSPAAALHHHFDVVVRPTRDADDPPPPEGALATFAPPPPPPPSGLPPLLPHQRGLAAVSYTRLAHDLDHPRLPTATTALDPAEFDVDDTLGELPPDELPPGAASGLLLHDLLERADLALARATPDAATWAASPTVAAALTDAARSRGVAARHLAHAARLAHATLTQPMLTGGLRLPALIDATALAREVEFSFPLEPQGSIAGPPRGLVRGFIDALVVHDHALWVLDYKSDLLAGPDLALAARHRVDQRYAVQVRLYALAAARLATAARPLAGLLYAFVRHGVTVAIPVDAGRLADWARWLTTLELLP